MCYNLKYFRIKYECKLRGSRQVPAGLPLIVAMYTIRICRVSRFVTFYERQPSEKRSSMCSRKRKKN